MWTWFKFYFIQTDWKQMLEHKSRLECITWYTSLALTAESWRKDLRFQLWGGSIHSHPEIKFTYFFFKKLHHQNATYTKLFKEHTYIYILYFEIYLIKIIPCFMHTNNKRKRKKRKRKKRNEFLFFLATVVGENKKLLHVAKVNMNIYMFIIARCKKFCKMRKVFVDLVLLRTLKRQFASPYANALPHCVYRSY